MNFFHFKNNSTYDTTRIHEEVKKAGKKILIVENKFICNHEVTLKIEFDTKISSDATFRIKDKNNNEICIVKDSIAKFSICDLNGKPFVKISETSIPSIKRKIYVGKKNDNKIVGTIKPWESSNVKRCLVEFKDKKSKRHEFFYMVCDQKLHDCGIFYGRTDNNTPLICKISRDTTHKRLFNIKIAGGIDIAFMLALCLYFTDKSVQ